jgi:hypothetical protein
MPWQLILSAVPIVILLLALVRYEVKSTIHQRKKEKEEKEVMLPLVEKVQKKHTAKYGRPDTELEREFRAMSEAK